jgi:RNA polymerase sigma-70 factor (ECF subfamily)
MSIDPDIELVRQCQSKDPAEYERAFYEVYSKYGERAYNISYRILGNADDALDVTQDAFLTLFKKIRDFRSDSRFFTWFYRIVVNLSIDKRRKRGSIQLVSHDEQDGAISDLPDEKSDNIEKLAWNEFLETHIQASLMKLNHNLRAVTVLRYIEGLSYAEISETMDCSMGTVKSRLNRAHKMLENNLKPLIEKVMVRKKEP